MTGAHMFNEVFFTDVRIPAENLVGDENEGWTLAKVTLGNERVSLSSGGALWGMGPTADDLLDVVRRRGGVDDPITRQRARAAAHRSEGARPHPAAHGHRRASRASSPGPKAAIRKVLADEHGQHIMRVAQDLAGAGRHAHRRRPAGHCGGALALRLPVQSGADDRRRHRRRAAHHHRRALGLPTNPRSSSSARLFCR